MNPSQNDSSRRQGSTICNLTQTDICVLHEALDDEYHAWATYDQVTADFGEVAPFSNIRESEERHIAALIGLFEQHGLSVPANPWPGRVERYSSVQVACEAGVAAELANGDMYERLLSQTLRSDIRSVLRKLQAASQQRHLPAFRRCAAGAIGDACRQGRRRRGGRSPSQ